jgi:hypothetical protein
VEKPVVAPQSRWNNTATWFPSGERLREATVFWQASEHPEHIINAASIAAFIGTDRRLGVAVVNDRFRALQNDAKIP